MVEPDLSIAYRRLLHQHLARPISGDPADVVARLGAIQAQDYAGAKWAIGLRLQGIRDHQVEQAFNDGALLRTHLLRPTWHFVTPTDIRWMLSLTAPRVHSANAHMYRRLELDATTVRRTNAVLAGALEGGRQLTRQELRAELEMAGIPAGDGQRLAYIVMHAEFDGVICSGPRRGKQFTYALLEDRAPEAKRLEREEALAELTRRYFSTRGPATAHDFARWSGLTVADARRGIDAVSAELRREVVGDRVIYAPLSAMPASVDASGAYLLSIYDEYISSYKDRSDLISEADAKALRRLGNAQLQYAIVVDGQIVGFWRRTLRGQGVTIEISPFAPLTNAQQTAIAEAAHRYGEFLELPVDMA
jgi:hypothetical protein